MTGPTFRLNMFIDFLVLLVLMIVFYPIRWVTAILFFGCYGLVMYLHKEWWKMILYLIADSFLGGVVASFAFGNYKSGFSPFLLASISFMPLMSAILVVWPEVGPFCRYLLKKYNFRRL